MSVKKIVLAMSASLVMASGAYAEGAAGTGPNPYSDCGIGAALFPNHAVGATISNVIWDIGTTAVISATASPETCSGKNVQAAMFILESYDQLLEETAKGSGDHLATLFDILETEDMSRGDAVVGLREQVANTVSAEDYVALTRTEKASKFYDAVMQSLPSA